jgi:hypothetical protein
MINKFYEFIGNVIISFGSGIIRIESIVYIHFNYIDPIYNGLKRIESIVSNSNIYSGGPAFKYHPANVRSRHMSTCKHLCSYFARKRRNRRLYVISGSNQSKNDDHTDGSSNNKPSILRPMETYENLFHPMDDPSCQDNTWYDAISPYWTGGMIWDGAYILNHQVVSVTTDPIFVSDLPPALEMSATIQAPEAKSEGKNDGRRVTIAIDSGSSIHIFKDAFLLTDIISDDKQSIGVRTTDSRFRVNQIGCICDDLNTLPLPSKGYYYYPIEVANLLSLAMIAVTKQVVMDTAIDDAIYVFNEDGTYMRFARTANGMYCIDLNSNGDEAMVMAHRTVKGESAKFSAIDCRRAEKIRHLQEVLACPSDYNLANAVEHNVIGNNPFTRRDVRIAKQVFGPDVPAMKGKTVKSKSKMPRENKISDLPYNIIKEYSDVHLSINLMHVNGINFLISY